MLLHKRFSAANGTINFLIGSPSPLFNKIIPLFGNIVSPQTSYTVGVAKRRNNRYKHTNAHHIHIHVKPMKREKEPLTCIVVVILIAPFSSGRPSLLIS